MYAGHRKIIYFMLASELLFIYLLIYLFFQSLIHFQGYNGGKSDDLCFLEVMPGVLYKFKDIS
jgi:hypothetical protein